MNIRSDSKIEAINKLLKLPLLTQDGRVTFHQLQWHTVIHSCDVKTTTFSGMLYLHGFLFWSCILSISYVNIIFFH